MKKYQLLEKAMRDYPKDSVARFASAPKTDHTSDGIFQILDINHDGTIGIYSGSGLNCFYISHDENGKLVDQWATIISKPKQDGEMTIRDTTSILSGKVAIQVNNEREFKLLMEHYESKGWKSFTGTPAIEIDTYVEGNTWRYEDKFGQSDIQYHEKKGYIIIQFRDFAEEVDIKAPVKVLASEDGVDLYEGDGCFCSVFKDGKWILDEHTETSLGIYQFRCTDNGRFLNTNNEKTFSTKEAATKWCEEHNKPQAIDVQLFNMSDRAVVIEGIVTVSVGGVIVTLAHSDIEDIQHAINELNCYKTPSK